MSSYDLRYDTNANGNFNFASASPVTSDMLALGSSLSPVPGGQTKSVAVDAVAFADKSARFAVVAVDSAGNEGAVSNTAEVGGVVPDVYPPGTVDDLIVTYDEEAESITVEFTAPGDDLDVGTGKTAAAFSGERLKIAAYNRSNNVLTITVCFSGILRRPFLFRSP